MTSDANPKDFFNTKQSDGKNSNNDTEFDTIWWKLYTWQNAVDSACPAGWSVPSDEQWETLETTLNWWINCRNSIDWRQCEGLWWNGHNDKTNVNNLSNALKIPIAGIRNSNGFTFGGRGHYTNLWSSTHSSANAYNRNLNWDRSQVNRNPDNKDYGFSVRCIKN